MSAILIGGLFLIGMGTLSTLVAWKLFSLLRRREGVFRGVHISRRENPASYWFTAGALLFAFGVTLYGVYIVLGMLRSMVG